MCTRKILVLLGISKGTYFETQLINYLLYSFYYTKIDMDEVGCMDMEWIYLVQCAALSPAFVDTGRSQSVSPSVSQTICGML
jgi:hypothetical protein